MWGIGDRSWKGVEMGGWRVSLRERRKEVEASKRDSTEEEGEGRVWLMGGPSICHSTCTCNAKCIERAV